MKLYRVEVSAELYVVADCESKANEVALNSIREYEYWDTWAEPAKMETTPPEWLGCHPYGGDGKRTVREILKQKDETLYKGQDK